MRKFGRAGQADLYLCLDFSPYIYNIYIHSYIVGEVIRNKIVGAASKSQPHWASYFELSSQ